MADDYMGQALAHKAIWKAAQARITLLQMVYNAGNGRMTAEQAVKEAEILARFVNDDKPSND
jgi:hypothetical protein